jgi:hypothetical protein
VPNHKNNIHCFGIIVLEAHNSSPIPGLLDSGLKKPMAIFVLRESSFRILNLNIIC